MQAAVAGNPIRHQLALDDALALLDIYGVPVLAQREASFAGDIVEAAIEIGFPVALKAILRSAVARDIAHGLALDLDTPSAVATTLVRMRSVVGDAARTVTIQKMGRSGVDAQIVAASDSRVGPVIAIGRGGSGRSPRNELAVRLAPIGERDAKQLVDRSPLADLVDGPSAAAVAELVHKVARIVAELPQVVLITLDPVLVGVGGYDVTDVEVWVAASDDLATPAVRRL